MTNQATKAQSAKSSIIISGLRLQVKSLVKEIRLLKTVKPTAVVDLLMSIDEGGSPKIGENYLRVDNEAIPLAIMRLTVLSNGTAHFAKVTDTHPTYTGSSFYFGLNS